MTQLQTQLVPRDAPDRLRERLAALGVTAVRCAADGRAAPEGGCRWIERLLLDSPALTARVRELWPLLAADAGGVAELWPGLWLVPLPAPRRRRPGADRRAPSVLAAMLAGPDLLTGEALHRVCDTAGVDYRAAVARVERGALVSPAEARRLAAALSWMHQDSLEIARRHDELRGLSEQLSETYEELSLLYKLSTSVALKQPAERFLTEACRELQQVLGLKWMAMQLVEDEPRLQDLAGRVFLAGPAGCAPETLRRIGAKLLPHRPSAEQPLVVDDTRALGIPELPPIASNLLVVSMLREGRPYGILYGGDKLDGTRIGSVDSKLCNALASTLSIFLENRILYEDMEAMFLGTLHALTRSIDAKDSYTRGHSERVALMSRRLAAAAGLDEKEVERVYLSGLVHDVGKIGVPEAVLTKSGKLTDAEFAQIRKHPEIGAQILRDIRQMQDLVPGVLSHHERWDGRGYPHGLARERIPRFGRLICLADSFDAMSSNRTYRRALDHRDVLAEVARCAGSQFDPDLAAVFVKLDFGPFFELLRKHQAQAEDAGGNGAGADRSLASNGGVA